MAVEQGTNNEASEKAPSVWAHCWIKCCPGGDEGAQSNPIKNYHSQITSYFISTKPHWLGKKKKPRIFSSGNNLALGMDSDYSHGRLIYSISLISTTSTIENHTNKTKEIVCELTGWPSCSPASLTTCQASLACGALLYTKRLNHCSQVSLTNLPLSILRSSAVTYLDSDSIYPLIRKKRKERKRVVKHLRGRVMQKK